MAVEAAIGRFGNCGGASHDEDAQAATTRRNACGRHRDSLSPLILGRHMDRSAPHAGRASVPCSSPCRRLFSIAARSAALNCRMTLTTLGRSVSVLGSNSARIDTDRSAGARYARPSTPLLALMAMNAEVSMVPVAIGLDDTRCPSCPICHSAATEFMGINRQAGSLPVYGCTECRYVWEEPEQRPRSAAVGRS